MKKNFLLVTLFLFTVGNTQSVFAEGEVAPSEAEVAAEESMPSEISGDASVAVEKQIESGSEPAAAPDSAVTPDNPNAVVGTPAAAEEGQPVAPKKRKSPRRKRSAAHVTEKSYCDPKILEKIKEQNKIAHEEAQKKPA